MIKYNKKEHVALSNLKTRCYNPNNKRYKDYGGRGITVCDEWLNSFESFYKDMGDCPEGCTIDRIDNNLGYNKENCRWATRLEQDSNKRNSFIITYKGETKPLFLFCKELGLKYSTTLCRIKTYKWSIEDALEIAKHKKEIVREKGIYHVQIKKIKL